jgi:hypothetical protein
LARSGVYRAPPREDAAAATRRIDALHTDDPFYSSRPDRLRAEDEPQAGAAADVAVGIAALGPKPRTGIPARTPDTGLVHDVPWTKA